MLQRSSTLKNKHAADCQVFSMLIILWVCHEFHHFQHSRGESHSEFAAKSALRGLKPKVVSQCLCQFFMQFFEPRPEVDLKDNIKEGLPPSAGATSGFGLHHPIIRYGECHKGDTKKLFTLYVSQNDANKKVTAPLMEKVMGY